MIHSTPLQIKNFFLDCIQTKTPYRDTATNIRHVIKSEGVTIMTKDDRFPTHELFFIKAVKSDINKLELFEDKRVKAVQRKMKKDKSIPKIKYVGFSNNITPGIKLKDCLEIDISAAYWQTAFQLGLITDKLYARALPMTWEDALTEKIITRTQYKKCVGLTPGMAFQLGLIDQNGMSKIGGISKKTRLASIGSLARKKVIRKFTGKRWYILYEAKDKLAYLWDVICYQVSQIMQQVAKECGDDFLMYWVDAVFIKKKSANKVKKIFTDYGYTFKEYKLDKIWTDDKELFIKAKSKASKVEVKNVVTFKDTRTFQLPRANKTI